MNPPMHAPIGAAGGSDYPMTSRPSRRSLAAKETQMTKSNGDAKKVGDGSVDPKKLKALMSRCRSFKDDMDSIRGDLGIEIKDAEDNMPGFHRAAFKLCMKLMNKEVAQQADFLRALDNYCHILGIGEAKQPDMLPKTPKAEPAQPAPVH